MTIHARVYDKVTAATLLVAYISNEFKNAWHLNASPVAIFVLTTRERDYHLERDLNLTASNVTLARTN